eukprot:213747-Chlamydomonas_euryale.AAC.5
MQKGGTGARHELDLLAAVMAVPARAQHADNFKLNLFDLDGPGVSTRAPASKAGHTHTHRHAEGFPFRPLARPPPPPLVCTCEECASVTLLVTHDCPGKSGRRRYALCRLGAVGDTCPARRTK